MTLAAHWKKQWASRLAFSTIFSVSLTPVWSRAVSSRAATGVEDMILQIVWIGLGFRALVLWSCVVLAEMGFNGLLREFDGLLHDDDDDAGVMLGWRGNLHRHGSVTSAISVDKEDATKKRRVERSRKMAEAKERNSTPAIPSDMQSVLKRCEILEKEVRSLKLNLSFMNRKDSEQTKQIEELQKQNEDLLDEKDCLIEEIKRIMSETGKI
ncbi:hypothetical protein L484_006354 [Morus notabilis]|uniref:Uncharacterized protein n=1 Tax=Morus notabilis TaxID=981085 RepID=W9RBR6_9ROSA|nr:hypothetical protein L484_006354 [Morus notabilis]